MCAARRRLRGNVHGGFSALRIRSVSDTTQQEHGVGNPGAAHAADKARHGERIPRKRQPAPYLGLDGIGGVRVAKAFHSNVSVLSGQREHVAHRAVNTLAARAFPPATPFKVVVISKGPCIGLREDHQGQERRRDEEVCVEGHLRQILPGGRPSNGPAERRSRFSWPMPLV